MCVCGDVATARVRACGADVRRNVQHALGRTKEEEEERAFNRSCHPSSQPRSNSNHAEEEEEEEGERGHGPFFQREEDPGERGVYVPSTCAMFVEEEEEEEKCPERRRKRRSWQKEEKGENPLGRPAASPRNSTTTKKAFLCLSH